MSPRVKLLLLAAFFAAPIVASVLAYNFLRPAPTANHGELLLPPATVAPQAFGSDAGEFRFASLSGKWILVVSDSGACAAACQAKLVAVRQARLALGRDAIRVERVFVVDDLSPMDPGVAAAHPGLRIAVTPRGMLLPPGAANDRAHIYLVDPRGNVMMRWPAAIEPKRVLSDLKRLLKASQIG